MCNVCEVVCSWGVTNGIVHNAKCVMYVRSSVVGETQMALSSMPNEQRKTVDCGQCQMCKVCDPKCSKGDTNGILHNAKCAMYVRPSVVGEAQMALCTMPNVQCQ